MSVFSIQFSYIPVYEKKQVHQIGVLKPFLLASKFWKARWKIRFLVGFTLPHLSQKPFQQSLVQEGEGKPTFSEKASSLLEG